MAAERGAHLAVVVVQQAHAPLVVGVSLLLVLEHRHRPPLGLRHDGLGVPVGALHQPHAHRRPSARRPGDHVGEVVVGVLQVRLHDHTGLEPVERGLADELAEQLQRQVLDVVVLHVEEDARAGVGSPLENGAQPGLCLRQPLVARQRPVERRERGGLHADVDARQRADVVALEMVVGCPANRRVDQCLEQALDPRPVGVGLGLGDGLLP